MPRNDDLKIGKLYDVSGYIAVVSGGGTGIGLMITQALIANGASKVYITGRRQEVLDTVVKEYSEQEAGQGKIIAYVYIHSRIQLYIAWNLTLIINGNISVSW